MMTRASIYRFTVRLLIAHAFCGIVLIMASRYLDAAILCGAGLIAALSLILFADTCL